MLIQFISLFPEMFEGVLASSMLYKAQDKNLVNFELVDLRQFGIGPRLTVDDTPYGGGDGMLLKPEPLFAAVRHAKQKDAGAEVLLMTPRGKLFNQAMARKLSADKRGKIIICGRYEGYDERITSLVDKQIRVGNFVLTGGELPAMVVADAITRLVPGVLGGETSAQKESFARKGQAEHPQYTRPEVFEGLAVPKVLLSGNHQEIEKWRKNHTRKLDDK